MNNLKIKMQGLESLLNNKDLNIPPYQRPYSWTEKQLEPLIYDLYNRNKNVPLIMGGIIFHKDENNVLNIVDGQQRLITYSILEQLICEKLAQGKSPESKLLEHEFTHADSVKNIKANAQYISKLMERKGIPDLGNIHFIVVETTNRDDAFSFFDSQNTRGKKLENYDILKAHHLRFIKSDDLATTCTKDWELIEKDEELGLGLLLETYLARGRKWSNRYNGVPDIREEFKSQRSHKKDSGAYNLNRYQQAALFSSWKYTPGDNGALELTFNEIDATYKIGSIVVNKDAHKFFPFQVTQTIEGGELFFWYTQKYYALSIELFSQDNPLTSAAFKKLLDALKAFDKNTGAVYTKEVYKGALLFYIDKFGYTKLDVVASNLFYSIYLLRLKQPTVQYASVYKYTREEFNPFALIREASFPDYIINECQNYLEKKFDVSSELKGIRADIVKDVFNNPDVELVNGMDFKKYNSSL
jgi:hypothetical protein